MKLEVDSLADTEKVHDQVKQKETAEEALVWVYKTPP